MNDRHFANFNIAGFTYYDAVDIFSELHIGTTLHMRAERENPHDANAVALYYREYKLGYVPRSQNLLLSKLLRLGHADLFEVKVNRVTPEAHTEQQVSVVVRMAKKKRR